MSFLYGLKNKRLDGRAIVQASGKMAGILMNKKKFKACAPLGTDSFEIKMKKAKTVEKSPIHLAYFVYNYAVSWQGSL